MENVHREIMELVDRLSDVSAAVELCEAASRASGRDHREAIGIALRSALETLEGAQQSSEMIARYLVAEPAVV